MLFEVKFSALKSVLKHGMSIFDNEFHKERYEFHNQGGIYIIKFPCDIYEMPHLELYIVVEYNTATDTYELYVDAFGNKSLIFHNKLPKKYRKRDFWERMNSVYN